MQTVGIVGYGSFGALAHELINRFSPQTIVRVYARDRHVDGALFFSLEEVAACDVVIFAVPVRVLKAVLAKIVPLTRLDTVLVDVATVKGYTTKLLKQFALQRPYIATHPMWGPESYKKRGGDVRDFRIVVTGHTLEEERYRALSHSLRTLGFDLIEMKAEQHDAHLAETLFLTHFVGHVITDAKFDRTEIDTVSFGYLMDAVESVRRDTALFHDVFTYVPACKKVLKRFNRSLERVIKNLSLA